VVKGGEKEVKGRERERKKIRNMININLFSENKE